MSFSIIVLFSLWPFSRCQHCFVQGRASRLQRQQPNNIQKSL